MIDVFFVSAPRLQTVTDNKRNVVLLQLEAAEHRQNELKCQMFWNKLPGKILSWVS